uniref:RNA-directed DNA polymerase n=1 Tax=Pseudomonas chlororaphis TaxID=587753 RepID=UPI0011CDA8DA
MLEERHFSRAIDDIAAHGDNDTLPFDVDSRFIAASKESLIKIALKFSSSIESGGKDYALKKFNELPFFSERLLTPAGSAGFRTTTKIHPFWNIYFNALGVAIAERHEPKRSSRAHSYRFLSSGTSLFNTECTWRNFREQTLSDCISSPSTAVVVQTDISSFYEHIYHHRIQNFIASLFPDSSTLPIQVDRMLNNFSSGRSFGLPVGGQCARVLAELLMGQIDNRLNDEGIVWRRYVDDFVLIANNQNSAYEVLSVLSHALADYGLSLSKTKTSILKVKHYEDYIRAQLGEHDESSNSLREIDLHFDPYSDTAESDYEELKAAVNELDIIKLVEGELGKSQPDNFIVTQISRTLKLLSSNMALEVTTSLLNPINLHAFRASFSKIMRGVSALREDKTHQSIHSHIDFLL